jgi:hypothetical protein
MKPLSPDIYIVDGHITLFLGLHPEQFKENILHASLLASLIANGTAERWLSSYTTSLGRLFWESGKFKNSRRPKSPSSVLKIATNALSEELSEKQLQQLKTALSIVTQLPSESPASNAFLSRIQTEKPPALEEFPSFNVSTLLTIVCENKKIVSLQLSLETSKKVDITFLEQPIRETLILGDIETSLWSTRLIEDKYASIRNQVFAKLGSKARTHLFHAITPETETETETETDSSD